MKKNVVIIMVLMAFIGSPILSQAQEWTKQQKEVWTAVNGWWENSKNKNGKALIESVHADYKGWSFDNSFPGNKEDLKYWVTNQLPKRETLHTSLKPLEILVSGDVAVLHYYYSEIRKVDDKEKTVSGRWTDVWKKEDGKWKLFADSGGEMNDKD